MYDLGENFRYDISAILPNPECIFKGKKYRITILTERLVRLEYSENGAFNDRLTEVVLNRNFKKPQFDVQETNSTLAITTRYFKLSYLKEKSFYGGKITPTKNLKIELNNTDKVWYYGNPEVRNFEYAAYQEKNKIKRKKSLYSIDGYTTIDDSKNYIIFENGELKANENNQLDIYVFMYNKDYFYCLNDYYMLTGFPEMLPRYAFGTMVTKNANYNQYSLIQSIRKYQEHSVPISSYILKNWESQVSYEFSNDYNELDKLIGYLNSNNISLGLSIRDKKVFDSNTKNYGLLSKYLGSDASGNIPFNLYNPRCVDAFLKLIIHPIKTVKNSFFELEGYNNLERLRALKHYLNIDSSSNLRNFIISRNFDKVPHRNSILYSGESKVDWQSLKNAVKFNTSAGDMGISYWSHDFGGTTDGIEDSELYTRFIQLGTFSPILRLGSDYSKYYKREPWKWGISTSEIATYFLNLRYKLIPYIYTESYKYYKYGKPLIEPIYYRYPELFDDVLFNDNYFFGSTFYISPIMHKKDQIMDRVIHKLYIPEGTWYDYISGKKYTGNKRYVSFYKESEYPIFVKSGSIIPLSLNNSNDTSVSKKLEIQVFPGASNAYSIYEDDGITNNYKNGEYSITNIEYKYEKNRYTLTILPTQGKLSILPPTRDYVIRFKNTKPTTIVKCYVNGNLVSSNKSKKKSDLVVEINDVPSSGQLTVICSCENIEIENIKIINDDIVSIISDLPIKTIVKEKVDSIMFSENMSIKKKRIEIRKLANGKNYLERKYIDLFLKLLEYINEV